MLHIELAATEGRDYAARVLAGTATASDAGDRWVEIADGSHAAGAAFLSAYDAAGGPR